MSSAEVRVIVVSADSGPVLGDCIDRLLASANPLEVRLFDNASTDGEPQKVAAKHRADGRLLVHFHPGNLGFGTACNRAAVDAGAALLCFVNPDCLVEKDSIGRLCELLRGSPEIGIVGASILEADGSLARGTARRDPLLRRSLMTLSGLAAWQSRWPALQGVEMGGAGEPRQVVDAVSGACFAIRRSLFESLGGFDENYFLHCEDLDLCRRVRDAGMQVVLDTRTPVQHRQGSSSHHRAVFVARHKRDGMWRWFIKFDPAARSPFWRVVVRAGLQAQWLLTCLRNAGSSGASR